MRAIATITWPALMAPVIGPLIGAWITTHSGWQWNFFINLPLGVLGVVLVASFVPRVPGRAPALSISWAFSLPAARWR